MIEVRLDPVIAVADRRGGPVRGAVGSPAQTLDGRGRDGQGRGRRLVAIDRRCCASMSIRAPPRAAPRSRPSNDRAMRSTEVLEQFKADTWQQHRDVAPACWSTTDGTHAHLRRGRGQIGRRRRGDQTESCTTCCVTIERSAADARGRDRAHGGHRRGYRRAADALP